MHIEIRYSWRRRWAGRMTTSRIKMTEQQALASDPTSVRVDGSREEVVIYDQPAELAYYGSPPNFGWPGQPWRSLLLYPCHVPDREGKVPLRGAPDQYEISQEGGVWTVVQKAAIPLLMYQGEGPVSIEAAT